MKVEIRDITKEEAVPYGDNADIERNRCIQQHVQSEFQKRRIRNELF